MNDHIATWKAEHANFTRLLDVMDAQIALFHEGEQPDYGLMLDVMHYMTHYPDRYHHPQEDLACRLLLKRGCDYGDAVQDLAEQHQRIAESGARLVADLNAVVDGAFLARATVEGDSAAYTRTLRQHMQCEEQTIFPALERLLESGDWAELTAATDRGADPMFGSALDRRYAALHARIAEQAGCGCPPVE